MTRWQRFKSFLRGLFVPSDIPGTPQTHTRRPPKEAPDNCPRCAGRIERVGEDYVCRGVATADEAREVMASTWEGQVPMGFSGLEPCGWHGRVDEFGVTWA